MFVLLASTSSFGEPHVRAIRAAADAAPTPLRFNVAITEPSSKRIVAAQSDAVETYPSLYLLDREQRLVAFAEGLPAIERAISHTTKVSDESKPSNASSLFVDLRLRPEQVEAAAALAARHALTAVLLTGEPCPPCDRARVAFDALDEPDVARIEVLHRPQGAIDATEPSKPGRRAAPAARESPR